MNTLRSRINRWIPQYARLPLIVAALYNFSVYYISRLIASDKPHFDFTLDFDRAVPIVPWTILLYWGCYLFWIVNYILCSRPSKNRAYRFLSADLLGKTVCFFFYVFLPTIRVRPQIDGSDIFSCLLRVLYAIDTPDNLFPSIHCFVSWLCYIGMRRDPEYSLKYRVFSLIFAIAVCISTLTTGQHVVVDVLSGVALAEICFFLTNKLVR